ncbi:MAG: SIMPL domain-containing protein [Candidatus Paceibacterota bacterium]
MPETYKDLLKNNVVAFGIVISVAWVASSFVLAGGIGHLKQNNSISVTGTAEKIVESDAGKWTFSTTRITAPEGYAFAAKQLRDASDITVKYLVNRGVDAKGITVQPVVTGVICQTQNQTMYDGMGKQQCSGSFQNTLSQQIIVESSDVNAIRDLSLNAANALSLLGVQIQTNSVDFFYTKLSDLRVELLAEASKNAKERAEAIAKSTGDAIGSVNDASQGVFQITQKNSTEVSDYGSYDTSTIEKKVTAIVRASFQVK